MDNDENSMMTFLSGIRLKILGKILIIKIFGLEFSLKFTWRHASNPMPISFSEVIFSQFPQFWFGVFGGARFLRSLSNFSCGTLHPHPFNPVKFVNRNDFNNPCSSGTKSFILEKLILSQKWIYHLRFFTLYSMNMLPDAIKKHLLHDDVSLWHLAVIKV